MSSKRIWAGLALLVLLLLAFAWLDGGREAPHEIVVPVAVPGSAG